MVARFSGSKDEWARCGDNVTANCLTGWTSSRAARQTNMYVCHVLRTYIVVVKPNSGCQASAWTNLMNYGLKMRLNPFKLQLSYKHTPTHTAWDWMEVGSISSRSKEEEEGAKVKQGGLQKPNRKSQADWGCQIPSSAKQKIQNL